MIFRYIRTAVVALVLVVLTEAQGDIYRIIGKGNTIAPLRSSEIAMDAETVLVEPESRFGGFRVTAVFTMRNTSAEPISCDVAFPFESKGHATNARESFRVSFGVNASEGPFSPVELKVRDETVKQPRSPYDFAAALVWKTSWAAGETKLIRIAYDMGEPEWYRRFVEGWRLRYIVRTGALWKGPIGRADITMRIKGNPMLSEDFVRPASKFKRIDPPFSYPANARQVSPTEVTWHFENWTPDEDIWFGFMQWVGFTFELPWNNWVQLPVPYVGAKEDYTDALLENLVDRELAPWRDSFPEEAKRDRPILKALAAEWLYREMFARHGDPFYLGKRKEGQPEPVGARGYDQNDNYLSWWSDKFPRPMRGGWYRPGTGPGPNGSVRLSDLTAQERKNAEFLSRYFSP